MKRMVSLALAFVLAVGCLTVTAFAERGQEEKNGITHTVAATAYTNSAGSYVLCNSATYVKTSLKAYNASGTLIASDSETGTVDAMAEVYPTKTGSYATGTCTATISGSSKSGPSITVDFD